MRTLTGWKKTVIGLWLTVVSIFALYTATFGIMQPRIQRGVHLLFLLADGLHPLSGKQEVRVGPDSGCMTGSLAFLSLLPALYIMLNNAP